MRSAPDERLVRPALVTLLGFVALSTGVAFLIVGAGCVAVPLMSSGPARLSAGAAGGLALLAGLAAVLHLTAGFALLALRPLGRALALVLAVLWLPALPVGTVVGLALLWFLTRPGARVLFSRAPRLSDSEVVDLDRLPATAAAVTGVVVGAVVLGMLAIPVLGIVAAIAIPNFLVATERARQVRTVADMRQLGIALETYRLDHGDFPAAADATELFGLLEPDYGAALPREDGWRHPYRYAARTGGRPFLLSSGGKDGAFDGAAPAESRATHYFDCDIVLTSGGFLQVPQGLDATLAPPPEPEPAELADETHADSPWEPIAEEPVEAVEPVEIAFATPGDPPAPATKPDSASARHAASSGHGSKPAGGHGHGAGPGSSDEAPIVDRPFSKAKLVKQVTPVYPPIAKRAGVSGMVILEAIIDTDGDVGDVKVLRSVPLLDQAAIDAVKQWRFEPGTDQGRPVRMRLTVTVRFDVAR